MTMRINLTHLAGTLTAISFAFACGTSHGPSVDAGPLDDGAAVMDGGAADGGPRIDGGAVDAGMRATCDAQLAAQLTCPELTCDGPPSWHWNGDRCFAIGCGECTGADCERGWGSEASCIEAHAECEASLCRATGGRWLWWAEECGHYACGGPPPATCEAGFAVCDCGPEGAFNERSGCVPITCPLPPPRTREMLCTETGGSWESICCDTVCGEFCAAACLAPACNCGPARVFDEERGCLETEACHDRAAGQTCTLEATRCAAGTICCRHLGGPGKLRSPTCEVPMCDDDPDVDECGNNLLAP
jgi:hypothetical protein